MLLLLLLWLLLPLLLLLLLSLLLARHVATAKISRSCRVSLRDHSSVGLCPKLLVEGPRSDGQEKTFEGTAAGGTTLLSLQREYKLLFGPVLQNASAPSKKWKRSNDGNQRFLRGEDLLTEQHDEGEGRE